VGCGWAWLRVDVLVAAGNSLPEAQPTDKLTPNELIETVQVKITVGTDGEALNETVALDPGPGFPFWLAPV
jgi:hypothetical protein